MSSKNSQENKLLEEENPTQLETSNKINNYHSSVKEAFKDKSDLNQAQKYLKILVISFIVFIVICFIGFGLILFIINKNKNDSSSESTLNEVMYLKKLIEKYKERANQLEEEINELNEKIDYTEEKIILSEENLQSQIDENMKDLEPVKEEFKKKLETNFQKMTEQSKVLQGEDIKLINQAFKTRTGKNINQLKKIYDAREDGDSGMAFHSKCDNIKNTLVLIKSNENYRFGGFTSKTWNQPERGRDKDDRKAFVFSLNKQSVYKYKGNGWAIWCDNKWGPSFGGGNDIGLPEGFIKNKVAYTHPYSYQGMYYELTDKVGVGKDTYIGIDQVEVFEVISDEEEE